MSWWLRLPVHESGSVAKMLPDFVFIAPWLSLREKNMARKDAETQRKERGKGLFIFLITLNAKG